MNQIEQQGKMDGLNANRMNESHVVENKGATKPGKKRDASFAKLLTMQGIVARGKKAVSQGANLPGKPLENNLVPKNGDPKIQGMATAAEPYVEEGRVSGMAKNGKKTTVAAPQEPSALSIQAGEGTDSGTSVASPFQGKWATVASPLMNTTPDCVSETDHAAVGESEPLPLYRDGYKGLADTSTFDPSRREVWSKVTSSAITGESGQSSTLFAALEAGPFVNGQRAGLGNDQGKVAERQGAVPESFGVLSSRQSSRERIPFDSAATDENAGSAIPLGKDESSVSRNVGNNFNGSGGASAFDPNRRDVWSKVTSPAITGESGQSSTHVAALEAGPFVNGQRAGLSNDPGKSEGRQGVVPENFGVVSSRQPSRERIPFDSAATDENAGSAIPLGKDESSVSRNVGNNFNGSGGASAFDPNRRDVWSKVTSPAITGESGQSSTLVAALGEGPFVNGQRAGLSNDQGKVAERQGVVPENFGVVSSRQPSGERIPFDSAARDEKAVDVNTILEKTIYFHDQIRNKTSGKRAMAEGQHRLNEALKSGGGKENRLPEGPEIFNNRSIAKNSDFAGPNHDRETEPALGATGRKQGATRQHQAETSALSAPGAPRLERIDDVRQALSSNRDNEAAALKVAVDLEATETTKKTMIFPSKDTETAFGVQAASEKEKNLIAAPKSKISYNTAIIAMDVPGDKAISQGGKQMDIAGFPGVKAQAVIDQIMDARQQMQNDSGRIKITLTPPALGTVDLDVVVRRNRVEVIMVAEHAAVQQLLQSCGDEIKSALQRQDMKIENFQVFLNHPHSENNQQQSGFWAATQEQGRRESGNYNMKETKAEIAASQEHIPTPQYQGLVSVFA